MSFKCQPQYTRLGASSTKPNRVQIGFGHGNRNESNEDIEFGIRCDGGGNLQVSEGSLQGAGYKGTFLSYAATDVMTVRVTKASVDYLKNDVVFYTSATAPIFPLHVDTSILDVGARLDVTICSASTPTESPTAAPTESPTAAPTEPACTDTPASAAAVGSTLIMEASAEYGSASLDLLADGVLRFTNAKCLETTLCNTCGVGGGASPTLGDKVGALESQVSTMSEFMHNELCAPKMTAMMQNALSDTPSALTLVDGFCKYTCASGYHDQSATGACHACTTSCPAGQQFTAGECSTHVHAATCTACPDPKPLHTEWTTGCNYACSWIKIGDNVGFNAASGYGSFAALAAKSDYDRIKMVHRSGYVSCAQDTSRHSNWGTFAHHARTHAFLACCVFRA